MPVVLPALGNSKRKDWKEIGKAENALNQEVEQ